MRFILRLFAITLVLAIGFGTFGFAKTTINRGEGGEPATLDPQKITGTWEYDIVGDLFVGLLQHAKDASSIPAIAKSWTISKDGKVYTFKLRKDALWSDGVPITSEDFVYSFQRIINPKTAAAYANLLYPIKNAQALNTSKLKDMKKLGVKALDKYTLQITLESPTPYFLALLKHFVSYPVPSHVIKKYGKDWIKPEHIVSNGPFMLKEWKPQTYIKAVKNPKFFDTKDVKVDEVYYYAIEDKASGLKRFRAGEIDTYNDFPTEQYGWLKKNMPDSIRVAPYMGIYYYVINFRNKAFKDKRVREALNLALNREVLVDKIIKTGEVAAYSFVPKIKGYEYSELEFKSMPMKDRIKKAKRLLKEAGYSKEKPLEFTLSYNTSENHKKVAIAIASMWKPLGVKVKLFNSEVAVHYANISSGDFEIARAGYIANYMDPQNFLALFEAPNTFRNSAWENKEYNALMAKAAKTTDLEKRAKIMQKAEKIMLDDYATIPIYYYVSRGLVNKNIKGWDANPTDIHRTRWLSKK